MFVDVAKIYLRAGRGGDGAVAFHREKYVANGGPDGGDGGNGGNVVLEVNDHMSTLVEFRYKKKYVAQNGEPGGGKKCSGKAGQDLVIRVPRGTLVYDQESGALVCDMSNIDRFVICKGGRGGWGNQHFATPTRQAPRFAKPGLDGQEMSVRLELKLLADVGLAGFPNVGKSTLLSMVSAAKPKIANYHFTTLTPNLGVVRVNEEFSYVMADIPGIIEGASEGAGLGHTFLRHIDRCRLIVHIVDVSGSEGRDPIDDFEKINEELERYNPELAARTMIVAANKCDLVYDREQIDTFKKYIEEKGYPFFEMSAATRNGVDELLNQIAESLSKLPPIKTYEPEYVAPIIEIDNDYNIEITRLDGDVYMVEADWIKRAMGSVNFDDHESRLYFENLLRKKEVFDKLEARGVEEGDTIIIYDLEFEYVK
ncbi:MAG: GTPase ObgE [Clostridia bacterium]|nr:GTPase ObgE [Clostridia bacterium]